ncbi:MAG: patatin-like phospholipase family protein [Janthinobacterium lividum]
MAGSEKKTALILGGGGPAGIAWECGLLLGLQDAGIDLSQADRIVGTSAGSIVGTHLAVLGSLEQLFAARKDPLKDTAHPPKMSKLMWAFLVAKLFHRSVDGQRRSIGRAARRAKVQGEQDWLARIAGFLPKPPTPEEPWPDRDLLLTSIDAVSGQLNLWTRDSGIPLSTAVASSCAVPCVFPLVHVGGHPYMDGGIGSSTNAALGAGFKTVVILDPIARLLGKRSPVHAEIQKLKAQGSTVTFLAFDDRIHALVGKNLMDSSRGQRIAELGREQGQKAAGELQQQS